MLAGIRRTASVPFNRSLATKNNPADLQVVLAGKNHLVVVGTDSQMVFP